MVVMDENMAAVRVAVDSLTPFAPGVLKTISFKCSNEFSDRGILQFGNHRKIPHYASFRFKHRMH